jgi:carbon storage regulator
MHASLAVAANGKRWKGPIDAISRRSLMLVLSRKSGEGILIEGGITFTVLEANKGKVRLGIQAPDNVFVLREELAEFKTLAKRSNSINARVRAAVRP